MRSISSFIVALLLCFHTQARAQSMNSEDTPCTKSFITSELTACLEAAFKAADLKLNQTYAKVRRALPAKESAELARAQQLWIQYCNSTCKVEYDLYAGGTGGLPAHLACLEAETRAREAGLTRSFGWRLKKSGE